MIGEQDRQVVEKWKEEIERLLIGDIKKGLGHELSVGLIILTLVGVDCLSGYRYGEMTRKKLFVQFVETHFPNNYRTLGNDIYDLRSGLMHDCVIKSNRFQLRGKADQQSKKRWEHLKPLPDDPSKICFISEEFAIDFLKVWENYSNSLIQSPDLLQNFNKRLKAREKDEQTERRFLSVGENGWDDMGSPATGTYGYPPLSLDAD